MVVHLYTHAIESFSIESISRSSRSTGSDEKRTNHRMTLPSTLTPSTPDLANRTVAYFSMEIALSPALPTYSGGLGMLAGDTLRSAADTAAPMVAISLVHRRGYFRQALSSAGLQTEADVPWSPETTLPFAGNCVTIN